MSQETETKEPVKDEAPSTEVKDEASESAVVVQKDPTEFELDAADPLVIGMTWVLTMVAGKVFVRSGLEKARAVLPAVAVLAAIACRVLYDSLVGVDLTADTFLHAVGAAGIAVLGHSQFRSVVKTLESQEKE